MSNRSTARVFPKSPKHGRKAVVLGHACGRGKTESASRIILLGNRDFIRFREALAEKVEPTPYYLEMKALYDEIMKANAER